MTTKQSHIGRRLFLGGAGVLAPLAGSLEVLRAAQKPGARPKNIIFMVADGMSPSVLPLAHHFSGQVRGKGLLWQELADRSEAVRGSMDMASLDSIVTDSSSAASSWGSGARIFNAWVNMLPDGTRLTPIADLAKDKKKKVGLVTTATVTHATPAGFAAVSRKRDDEAGIAVQYLDKVDVVLGGGRKFFSAETRADKRDLVADFKAKGYAHAESRDQLLAINATRMLGLFSGSHMPYVIDHRNSDTATKLAPTLAEMTEVALKALSQNRDGFLLQVEGARVDHAAHANDAAGLLWEQLAFDDAIEVVLKFAAAHPETLIVITSDHGNANPGLIGMGTEYRQSNACFARLARVRASFNAISPRLAGSAEYTMGSQASGAKEVPTVARVQELAEQTFGFTFTPDEVDALRKCAGGAKRLCVNKQLDSAVGILGQVVGSHTGVFWTGTSHTSDYTLVTALGPGAERFGGYIRNTEVFPALTQLMDIDFKNPSMEAGEAMKFREAASLMRRERPDWA